MKQSNFTITVYSNTAETAKFQYDADIEIRNYGSTESDELTNGTNIYKEESIDSLYSTLYQAGSDWKKEYRGLERKKATLKAMVKADQREVYAIAYKNGDESYVVSILQDEAGSLWGNMIHSSRRDVKGRFVNGKVKNFALASSVEGAWSECAHGEKFNISFFVANKAKLNVNAVDKTVWKETTKEVKEKSASTYEEELQKRDIQILRDQNRMLEQRLAEMELKFAKLMEKAESLEKNVEVLEIRVEELEAKEVKAPEVKEVKKEEVVAEISETVQEVEKEVQPEVEAKPIASVTTVKTDSVDDLDELLGVEEDYKPFVPQIPEMDEFDRELLNIAA
ncbi:hypothetical protein ABZ276_004822 [Escherichia coli]|nr:hypothetical protein [Escherichia coli]EFN6763782.1 hypothetical protein [Escherichia coli O45:H11]ELT2383670.1 hypothetical protein [Shigella sonnei]EER0203720.1 hypothetical protein [Escherichia coli]EER5832872.1 hypothetical protein [Escherichia coli]